MSQRCEFCKRLLCHSKGHPFWQKISGTKSRQQPGTDRELKKYSQRCICAPWAGAARFERSCSHSGNSLCRAPQSHIGFGRLPRSGQGGSAPGRGDPAEMLVAGPFRVNHRNNSRSVRPLPSVVAKLPVRSRPVADHPRLQLGRPAEGRLPPWLLDNVASRISFVQFKLPGPQPHVKPRLTPHPRYASPTPALYSPPNHNRPERTTMLTRRWDKSACPAATSPRGRPARRTAPTTTPWA